VIARDEERCAYVDDSSGKRCEARGCLQIDHRHGLARAGKHDSGELRLLCAAHNQYEADRLYGRAFMDRHRSPGAAASHGESPFRNGGG
jgi:hypothetical protein